MRRHQEKVNQQLADDFSRQMLQKAFAREQSLLLAACGVQPVQKNANFFKECREVAPKKQPNAVKKRARICMVRQGCVAAEANTIK